MLDEQGGEKQEVSAGLTDRRSARLSIRLTATSRPLFHPLAHRTRQRLPDPIILLSVHASDQTLEYRINLLIHQGIEGEVRGRVVRVDRCHADERLTPEQEECQCS